MLTINVQAWLPASHVASIAKYMELTNLNSRQLSDIARISIEVLVGLLQKKGITVESEAKAIEYLEKRGFRIATRKDKEKKIVEALQQEALLDVERDIQGNRHKIETLLEES